MYHSTLISSVRSDWRTRIPEGYAVQHLDARTAAQVGGIVELWGSIDIFLAKGRAPEVLQV